MGGSRTGTLTSATQTFLKPTWPADSANIIDVTQSPYNADPTFNNDSTSAIQSAINAAASANNGSIVYIPCGLYRISSTLTASGGNYKVTRVFETAKPWKLLPIRDGKATETVELPVGTIARCDIRVGDELCIS